MNKKLYGYVSLAGITLLGLGLLVQGSRVNRPVGKWVEFGDLVSARSGACAANLPDGSMMIIGGEDENGPLSTVETLSLSGGAKLASMKFARSHFACVAMSDGRVLVAGGTVAPNGALNSAEIFDPSAGTWSDAGPMAIARVDATASLITVNQRQRILIAGGENSSGATKTLEIFDPESNSFSMASETMTSARRHHAAASLGDGRVILAGGSNGDAALDTIDVFDPASGTVSAMAKLSAARQDLTATLLLDGRVLLAGGNDGAADLATADILDPASASISTVAMNAAHSNHRAFLLPDNNTVVLAGGAAGDAASPAVERFVPWKNRFQPLDNLISARRGANGSAPKGKGLLVVAGGTSTAARALRSTESMRYAMLATDQPEYWSGQTITLNGDGWQPGETVAITMKHSGREDAKNEAIVDADGKFSAPVGDVTAADIGSDSTLIVSGAASEAAIRFSNIATPAGAFVGSLFSASGRSAIGSGASIATDKHLYHPGDTMIITGSGFNANNVITLTVSRPDKVVDSVPNVVSDLTGSFTAQYIIQGVNGALKIMATDGINTATTSAVDPPAVTPNIAEYSQCSNDLGDGFTTGPDLLCKWINGNLNPNNSGYHEGDATVQRAFLTDVTGGTDVHTITFQYDTTKNGSHAYDFLTDPRFSETFATDVCDGASGNGFALCSTTAETASPLIPTDPLAGGFDAIHPDRHFMIRNGTITGVELLGVVAGDYTQTSDTAIRVSFTVNTNTCNNATTKQNITTCPVLITFGAHVSKLSEWGPPPNNGTTASNISGSPYHVALVNIDGSAIGQRDNQMSTNLVNGSLTIVKRIVNDNGGTKVVGDFGITTSAGNLTFGAGVADGANTLKYTSNTLTNLTAGAKTLVELDVAGYTEGTWSCVGNATPINNSGFNTGSVTVNGGEDVVCTITNDDQPASLTVVKRIVNDNGGTKVVGDFGITTSAGALSFGAGAADGANTLKYTATTLTGLSAGSKTLVEVDVTGYTEGTWGCTGGGGAVVGTFNAGSVVLNNGESVTCTITNDDQPASLIVVKRIVNDNGGTKVVGDFGITTSAGALSFGAGAADGANTLKYTAATLTGLSAGLKTLAELDVTGYAEGTWGCAGGSGAVVSTFNAGSVVLNNGETVTCTITNNDDGASLTIVKRIVNDNGGTKVVGDFGITTSAGALSFGAGAADGANTLKYTATTLTGLSAGLKTLAELNVAGYTEGTWGCTGGTGAVVDTFNAGSVVLNNGETVTCTITNNDDPASLIVVKRIVNDNGGTKVVGDFGITTSAGALVFGAGVADGANTLKYTAGTLSNLSAGSKTLAELNVAGYTEGTWGCTGGTGAVVDTFNAGSVVLNNGETVTCTITNNDDPASLIVRKRIVNDNGGTKVVGDFGIGTSAGALLFDGGVADGTNTLLYTAGTLTGLSAGSKTLVESDVAGYTEGTWGCTGGTGAVVGTFSAGSVVLNNGETVTCTITNNDQGPSLTIVKRIVNDNGGGLAVGAFGITTNAGALTFGAGVADGANTLKYTSNTLTGITAGTKSLHEEIVANYQEGTWSCVGNAGAVNNNPQTGSVVLGLAETVVCTITNNDIPPTMVVNKVLVPAADPGKFNLTIDGATAGTGGNVGDGGTTGAVPVNAGPHTAGENVTGVVPATVLADYVTTFSANCPGGVVNVPFGGSATCTITNTKKSTVQVIKTLSGLAPTGTTSFSFDLRTGASAAADGTVISTGTANAGNNGTFVFNIKLDPAGTYQFCETGIPVGFATTISSLAGAFQPPNGLVNTTWCVPFGAGTAFPLTAGQQRTFTIDNTPPPGGGTRTIGYWKNWSSCDGKGKQAPSLDINLPQTVGDLTLAGGTPTGTSPAAGCDDAVDILNKSDINSGKKMASDPAYNLAAQLLAAKLNVTGGAGVCANSTLAIASGQALLDQINFNGTGAYAKNMSATQILVANTLATILDAYNQDNSVCASLPVPPSIVFTSASSTSISSATGGNFQVTAVANPGPAPTFSIISGAPAGVTISAGGLLTVPAGTAIGGPYIIKIAATSWGVVYQNFSLTVTP
ncbi:MAG: hypothetical protein HYX27_23885 [Acidobacteria bacterium]|nr:hypothetical protein [Acidobacteriota bacterium]